jgi:2-C-methyl-D-erythritol 4-phosphate cytidylyltransferase/2-C-methyl-D-erythritol 2,4-cyclodiphosphate synthase
VHAFRKIKADEKPSINLCGVEIEFDKKIDAHSDGDVAIHALIDALLGAVGEGDIGEHFPPSDEKWKDCDSRKMLKIIKQILVQKNAKIINIDLTLICEKPKILQFKKLMKQIDVSRVNIKATTTERLGFLGREEGIAAQAIASVSLYQTNFEEKLI